MKKLILLALAISAIVIGAMLSTVDVKAQCNGIFPNNTMCGNVSGSPSVPQAVPVAAIPVSSNTSWINVKQAPCLAAGNGVTDDTAAINTCIATFNSTSNGVLYFPAGIYLTTTTLTTITGSGIIRGDGATNLAGSPVNPPTPPSATLIETSSLTVSGFTFNTKAVNEIYDLSLYNISGTTPIAGAGITQMSSISNPKLMINQVQVRGYFVGIDLQEAAAGVTVSNTYVWDPVLYGIRIRNLVNADDGGWIITHSAVLGIARTATSGIRWDGSGGGGSINDVHVVGNTNASFTNGIDLQGTGATVDIGIVNFSIENIITNFININGSIPNVWIVGGEFGGYINCSSCIGININNTSQATVADVIFATSNFAPPIKMTSCSQCYVTSVNLNSSQTGGVYGNWPSADHDGTGGIGSSIYFAGTTGTSVQRLTWNGASSISQDLRVQLDPNTGTGFSASLSAINDLGNLAQFVMQGSTNGASLGVAGKGGLYTSTGMVFLTDSASLTGGPDDISLRAGGFNQEVMLVQHNGHINYTGQNQSAPTIVGGCGGTSSIVAGTDAAATVTGQNTAVTSCIVQWGAAYSSAPTCTASGNQAPLTSNIGVSTTSITVHFAGATSFVWSYICAGK